MNLIKLNWSILLERCFKMECNCGGAMSYYKAPVEDGDYFECDDCGERVYVNDTE